MLKGEPVVVNAAQRASVEKAIRDTCVHRKWHLHAFSVRTNHAHAVVSIEIKKPELALNAFKANATRQMREDGCWRMAHSAWVDRGSKRYLWNERSVGQAIDYVLYGQGEELPEFED
jgi:REP element-mobilizing transposase RayT